MHKVAQGIKAIIEGFNLTISKKHLTYCEKLVFSNKGKYLSISLDLNLYNIGNSYDLIFNNLDNDSFFKDVLPYLLPKDFIGMEVKFSVVAFNQNRGFYVTTDSLEYHSSEELIKHTKNIIVSCINLTGKSYLEGMMNNG